MWNKKYNANKATALIILVLLTLLLVFILAYFFGDQWFNFSAADGQVETDSSVIYISRDSMITFQDDGVRAYLTTPTETVFLYGKTSTENIYSYVRSGGETLYFLVMTDGTLYNDYYDVYLYKGVLSG